MSGTITKFLSGLAKKGIKPEVTTGYMHSVVSHDAESEVILKWIQGDKKISVFFDRITGNFKGYKRGATGYKRQPEVSCEILAKTPEYSRMRIIKQEPYPDSPGIYNRLDKERIVSLDKKGNTFSVLEGDYTRGYDNGLDWTFRMYPIKTT